MTTLYRKIYSFTLFLFSLFFSHSVIAVVPIKSSVDFSYENLTLPQNEVMGLMGVNYLARTFNYFDVGLGVYGAVRGKRGGFFTGGGQIQSTFPMTNFFAVGVDAFIGGGGGGAAPQGGGLMLRAALYLSINYKDQKYKLGYSHVNFPNGDIESNQISVGVSHSFTNFIVPGWSLKKTTNSLEKLVNLNLSPVENNFSLQTSHFFPFQLLFDLQPSPLHL